MKISNDGKPMMADKEIEYIKMLIEPNNYKNCLEWGSGNSTIYFPNACPCIQKWVSVEHNGHYIEYLSDKLNSKVINIWQPDADTYIDCVKLQGPIYDFILIDGLYRGTCLEAAFKLIKIGGSILLHDSGTKQYNPLEKTYKLSKVFSGEIPTKDGFYAHRGLSLFRN